MTDKRVRTKGVVHWARQVRMVHPAMSYGLVRLLCSGIYLPADSHIGDEGDVDCMTCLIIKAR